MSDVVKAGLCNTIWPYVLYASIYEFVSSISISCSGDYLMLYLVTVNAGQLHFEIRTMPIHPASPTMIHRHILHSTTVLISGTQRNIDYGSLKELFTRCNEFLQQHSLCLNYSMFDSISACLYQHQNCKWEIFLQLNKYIYFKLNILNFKCNMNSSLFFCNKNI